MLIISGVDGTVADNRHRASLSNNPSLYWGVANQDSPNPIGVGLIKELIDDNTLLVFVTNRPVYYHSTSGDRVNLYKQTKSWLHETAHLHAHEISMVDDRKHADQTKSSRVVRLVLEHITNRHIIFIDSDIGVIRKVKERCPTITTYLVDYDTYNKVTLM